MVSVGFLLMLAATTIAVIYGAAATTGQLLGRAFPSLLSASQRGLTRIGAGELWHGAVVPVLEVDAWLLLGGIGVVFLIIGKLRAL